MLLKVLNFSLPSKICHKEQVTPRPIEFKYQVVHHEKDLSNLKVDPLRVQKKQKLKSPTVKFFWKYDPTKD